MPYPHPNNPQIILGGIHFPAHSTPDPVQDENLRRLAALETDAARAAAKFFKKFPPHPREIHLGFIPTPSPSADDPLRAAAQQLHDKLAAQKAPSLLHQILIAAAVATTNEDPAVS